MTESWSRQLSKSCTLGEAKDGVNSKARGDENPGDQSLRASGAKGRFGLFFLGSDPVGDGSFTSAHVRLRSQGQDESKSAREPSVNGGRVDPAGA